MREIRLYTDQPLQPGQTIRLDKDASRHAVQVLRLQAGHPLTLFNGDGFNYSATLTTATKQADVSIVERHENPLESPLRIRLLQGVSRSERMDFTLQKAVELGVMEIIPLFTRRSVLNLSGSRLEKKTQHWQSVVSSAAEQSGRSRVPSVHAPFALTTYLSEFQADHCACVLVPGATQSLADLQTTASEFSLLIGPEGGLDEEEIDSATQAGFTGVSMGPRILRTETAGIAALSILQARFGDF